MNQPVETEVTLGLIEHAQTYYNVKLSSSQVSSFLEVMVAVACYRNPDPRVMKV